MKNISQRISLVPASPIRKLVPFAVEAKKQGVTVYHLNIGDPDIKTPDVFIKSLQNWKRNPISYGQSQGDPEFLEGLKNYYHKLGYPFIQIAHIQVTSGGSEAIGLTFFAVCEPGDEVLTFEPLYTNYNSYATIQGISLVPVLTKPDTGFHLPKKIEIEEKINKRTKAILICNPNNPTGTVYTRDEIEMLVKIAQKHGLFLIADEVYRDFVYDGNKHVSLLDYIEKMPNQIIVLDSMSKRYSLCGARLGMLISLNADLMAGILRIAQSRLSAGLIDQAMASHPMEVPSSFFKEVHKEYQNRRDILFEGLSKIPRVTLEKPEGAFYCIVGLPVLNAEDFCKWLLTDYRLHNETVMLAPASGFYSSLGKGKNEVRIAYVLKISSLKKAITILKNGLIKYLHTKNTRLQTRK